MKSAYRRILFTTILALMAFATAAPTLAHYGADAVITGAQSAPISATEESAAGTIDEFVVDNRVDGTTTRYTLLRQDDGTIVGLRGGNAESLPKGTRVVATGRRAADTLEVDTYAVVSGPAPPMTIQAAGGGQVQGTLLLAHADDFEHNRGEFKLVVRGDDGHATELQLGIMPDALRSGMTVVAYGTASADHLSLDTNRVEVLALPAAPRSKVQSVGTQSFTTQSLTTNKVLVLLVKFTNNVEPFTSAAVQQVMISNPGSVANYYNEVSYGQEALSITVTPTWLQSGIAPPATCDYSTISSKADAAYALAYPADKTTYQNRYYVFPSLGACGWAGLAYVGFGLAYSNGYNTLGVYGHELGHNFGLLHAGRLTCVGLSMCSVGTVAEYGDSFDVMGNISTMHFNAAQKSILQWIPSSSIKTHTAGTATYTLSPIESAGGATYAIKIPVATNRTYWVEYRQPTGFDGTALGAFSFPNNGAQIRVASPFTSSSGSDDTQLLDMTPGTSTFTDAALLAGQSYTDSTYGVTITVGSASPTSLAVTVSMGAGAATTTSLTSSANPSAVGAMVAFTASVTGTSPTGTVSFTDGGASIAGCAAVVLSGSGNTLTAQCATSALTPGTHSIAATYSGGVGNNASTSTVLSQVVNKATSTSTLVSSKNPSTVGVSVTLTATVVGVAPTGSVNFKDGGSSIAGCSAVALVGSGNSRTAACTTSTLTVATHSIVASYAGDVGNNASNSATLSQVVNSAGPAPTTTALASSKNPSTVGTAVTFTATVAGSNPTGTVNFKDGANSISGCSAVALTGSGNSKTAACSTSTLTAATHSITASYAGDAGNAASNSTTLSEVVTSISLPATTTTLASSKNPSTFGTSVSFTATVAGSNPTGSVVFKDGANSISGCTAVALVGSGNSKTAACSTSALTAATHSITASYGGDAGNAGSTSAALSQVVSPSTSVNVALASNGGVATASSTYSSSYAVSGIINNVRTGADWGVSGGWNDGTANAFPDWVQINFSGSKTIDHVVVYTVQDNYASPVEPTDSMTFTLYGITAFTVQGWNGTSWVTLGSVAGNKLVKRTVNFSAFATDRIRINITAALHSYSRITEVEAWGTAQVVPPSTTAIVSSRNPSTFGTSVSFTATVAGSNPTGSVVFKDGANSISGCTAVALVGSGNSKTAACSTSALTAATHSITASYGGDAGNAGSTSATLSQVVSPSASINVALASNGGVATASSTYSSSFAVSGIINNVRTGANWGVSGGWNDGTANAFPDWVQINFSGSKTIDHVVVYTVQDNYATPVEPTDTMTFSVYGITAFTVQGWNGTSWVTLGSVAGNKLVKRTVNFSAFATDRIRINITAALHSYSRITEVEAWGH
jgi:hypothetical protein